MPLVIHPRVRKGLARLAAMTAFGVLASSGVAMACPSPPVTHPFASLGDNNSYFPVPGGSFDGSARHHWWLENASITPGGDPLSEGPGEQSLTINAGGSAVSLPFCADSTMPAFRFFARHASPGGPLKVQIRWLRERFELGSEDAVLLDSPSSDWQLSPMVPLSSALSLLKGHSSLAQLRFSVPGSAGSWQLDDVYVDPYSFG